MEVSRPSAESSSCSVIVHGKVGHGDDDVEEGGSENYEAQEAEEGERVHHQLTALDLLPPLVAAVAAEPGVTPAVALAGVAVGTAVIARGVPPPEDALLVTQRVAVNGQVLVEEVVGVLVSDERHRRLNSGSMLVEGLSQGKLDRRFEGKLREGKGARKLHIEMQKIGQMHFAVETLLIGQEIYINTGRVFPHKSSATDVQ